MAKFKSQKKKKKKVAKVKLTIIPKSNAYLQTLTQEPAKVRIDWYKPVLGFAQVATACRQMPKSIKRNNSGRRIPTKKNTNMSSIGC